GLHRPSPFFRLLARPPPLSPLFPYTTLFRSALPAALGPRRRAAKDSRGIDRRSRVVDPTLSSAERAAGWVGPWETRRRTAGQARSEEHTSELQSQSNLVCRLLLEKKNKQKER